MAIRKVLVMSKISKSGNSELSQRPSLGSAKEVPSSKTVKTSNLSKTRFREDASAGHDPKYYSWGSRATQLFSGIAKLFKGFLHLLSPNKAAKQEQLSKMEDLSKEDSAALFDSDDDKNLKR